MITVQICKVKKLHKSKNPVFSKPTRRADKASEMDRPLACHLRVMSVCAHATVPVYSLG